jgi:hypothetical protein
MFTFFGCSSALGQRKLLTANKMKKSSFFVAEHILMNLIHKNKKKDIYISNIRNNLTRSDNPRQDWDKILIPIMVKRNNIIPFGKINSDPKCTTHLAKVRERKKPV